MATHDKPAIDVSALLKIIKNKNHRIMKNVMLFPGTDAIENPLFRAQAMKINGVADMVTKTEGIIQHLFGDEIDLTSYMTAPNDLSIEGFRKLVLCSLATQVAIYDNYVAINGKPDCVMGLSLGDVPRSVVSGLVSFEDGVRNLYLFTSYYGLAAPGMCVHVKLDDTFEVMQDQLRLEAYGVSKSVIQNRTYGLLAGPMDNVQKWVAEVAMPMDLRFRPMYPFPLHTHLMAPVADKLRPHVLRACDISAMHIDVFSTVYGKILTDNKEIIQDCTQNIAAALDFPTAIEKVIEHYGEVRFVNVGPSQSLVKFLGHMDLPEGTIVTDWYERLLFLNAA